MRSARKLEEVDGLRGLAVLLVIFFHHRLMHEGDATHSALYRLLAPFRFGDTGVHLFLVLSGFCLTHSLLRRRLAGREVSLRGYLVERWRRIAPPFYAAMALYTVATSLALATGQKVLPERLMTVRQLGTHLLFVHGLWNDTIAAINPPFWSLSLEFQFYITLPLLFVLAIRFGVARVAIGIALTSLAWRALVGVKEAEFLYLTNGVFLGRWTEFALGMCVAFWFNRPERAQARPRAVAACASGTIAILGTAMALAATRRHVGLDLIFGLGYALLLVTALTAAERAHWLGRGFVSRPLVWVGTISYSLYLTHSLVLDTCFAAYHSFVHRPNSATDAVLLATALGLIMAGGWLFYRLVERRFVRSVDAGRGEAREGPPRGVQTDDRPQRDEARAPGRRARARAPARVSG